MRFAVIAAVIALFATSAVAVTPVQGRCYPDYCNCGESSCSPSSPACCANGSCPC
ncbi:hypothetical protein R3P38DRAFT_3055143 [Favolaschia claudopus]|uniref:Uncharacterized protein n=2 Tax=Favolaschia claudopus TaxID=2862362 RepID=A0AAW0A3L0_9AGAR